MEQNNSNKKITQKIKIIIKLKGAIIPKLAIDDQLSLRWRKWVKIRSMWGGYEYSLEGCISFVPACTANM